MGQIWNTDPRLLFILLGCLKFGFSFASELNRVFVGHKMSLLCQLCGSGCMEMQGALAADGGGSPGRQTTEYLGSSSGFRARWAQEGFLLGSYLHFIDEETEPERGQWFTKAKYPA